MVILVEGASLATYLRATLGVISPSLDMLGEQIKDGRGVNQLDDELGRLIGEGRGDSTFAIWDQDVYGRPGKVELTYLPDHAFSHPLPRDFEAIFPAWMLADALKLFSHEHQVPVPEEPMIAEHLRAREPGTPTFDCLRACLQDHAIAVGGEPAAAEPPDCGFRRKWAADSEGSGPSVPRKWSCHSDRCGPPLRSERRRRWIT